VFRPAIPRLDSSPDQMGQWDASGGRGRGSRQAIWRSRRQFSPPWCASWRSARLAGSMRLIALAVVLTLGLTLAPFVDGAQQAGKARRIGFLSVQRPTTPEGQGPFYDRMRELGWIYGKDFVAEHRVFGDQLERVRDLADELIRAGVEVFVVGGAADARIVQQAYRQSHQKDGERVTGP
jgi:hypothetical protein